MAQSVSHKSRVSSGSITLKISTWFQVHRDVDEYCFDLILAGKTENFEVRCVEYRESDIYTRKIVEFALALIELETDSTKVPKIQVMDYDPRAFWEGWAPPEIYEVSIVHVREGVARLVLRHELVEEIKYKQEGVWLDEVRAIYFDLLEEDVWQMGYRLLSAVGTNKGSVEFSFDLRRAASPPPADFGNDVPFDDDIPFIDDIPF